MRIRPAQLHDESVLLLLPHAMHYDHHASFLRHCLGSKDCLIAEIGSEIAGFVAWDRGFYARPFLWMLGVSSTYQHRGVASALVERVESLNTGNGLYTSTNESNVAMQSLLRKRGYRSVGRLEALDPGDPELFFYKQL